MNLFSGFLIISNSARVDAKTTIKSSSSTNYYFAATPSFSNELMISSTHGYYSSKGSTSVMDIQADYLRVLTTEWQVGGGAHIFSATGSNYVEFWGEGRYNLSANIVDSFYGLAGAGFYNDISGGKNENKFGFFLGVGKRFQLWHQLNYSPEIRLKKVGSLYMEFIVSFINFSAFWNF